MIIRFGRKKCMIILVFFLLENLFRVVDTTTVNFFIINALVITLWLMLFYMMISH